eukprot:580345-Rhodomonas_salina.1
MSGTEIAYGAICRLACCAMSGTDLAYGATRQRSCVSTCTRFSSPSELDSRRNQMQETVFLVLWLRLKPFRVKPDEIHHDHHDRPGFEYYNAVHQLSWDVVLSAETSLRARFKMRQGTPSGQEECKHRRRRWGGVSCWYTGVTSGIPGTQTGT